MVLVVDIGNTNTVIGGFDQDQLTFVARIATNPNKTEDEYATKIRSVLSLHEVDRAQIEGAIISSVVPPLNSVLKDALRMAFSVEALLVGPGIKTGLNIHCDTPSSVGADLICASVAASRLYPAPTLIIDMGTATKMIVLDEKKTFIGVSIIPGVNVALKALTEHTAQLPQISLEAPGSAIGKNTIDSMRSGVIYGSAAMLDGMIDRICDEIGKPLSLVATGGLSKSIIRHCHHEIPIDPNLVLKGLYFIYQKNIV